MAVLPPTLTSTMASVIVFTTCPMYPRIPAGRHSPATSHTWPWFDSVGCIPECVRSHAYGLHMSGPDGASVSLDLHMPADLVIPLCLISHGCAFVSRYIDVQFPHVTEISNHRRPTACSLSPAADIGLSERTLRRPCRRSCRGQGALISKFGALLPVAPSTQYRIDQAARRTGFSQD
jgi:hypothetical protein